MSSLAKVLRCSPLLFLLPTFASAASCTGAAGVVASLISGVPEAQSYCSSKFPQGTNTVTASASTSTITATTTVLVTTFLPTVTITATATTSTETDTETDTATATAITTQTDGTISTEIDTATTTQTSTVTSTATATATVISTQTNTVTTIVKVGANKKRDFQTPNRPMVTTSTKAPVIIITAVPTVASVKPISTSLSSTKPVSTVSTAKTTTTAGATISSSRPVLLPSTTASLPAANGCSDPRSCAVSSLKATASAIASGICNCIQSPSTVTITPQTSATVTTTTTATITSTPITTTTPGVTATAMVTTTSTVTTTSVTTTTTTSVVTTTITATVTTVTTDLTTATVPTTVTTQTTATATVTDVYVPCNDPRGEDSGPGAGGCPSQCYCDHSNGAASNVGFCENVNQCGASCTTDTDCPLGTKCSDSYPNACGGKPSCLDSSSCVGQKRLAVRGDLLWQVRQAENAQKWRRDEVLRLRPVATHTA